MGVLLAVCVYTTCVSGSHRVQNWVLEPTELETVVSHLVGAGIQTQVLWKSCQRFEQLSHLSIGPFIPKEVEITCFPPAS